ncbi:uncharacterized protein [Branchiostoma lanceolatum]|uniref:uncharacterized protein n=1 Tax=Branchiostoma lanceolatum TaxID=7740 RepID=UPI0034554698
MTDINMTSLADKLQNLQLESMYKHGRALREAILSGDNLMEVIYVLKGLGDLHLEKGKLSKQSSEFDKAAAMYAAALLRCTDPDIKQTLEHRIGYMEKLSRQLLQGYTPQYQSQDSWGTTDSNVLRVAKICDKLGKGVGNIMLSVEDRYSETLVSAIVSGDVFLEVEILKSLGDFYLEKGMKTSDVSKVSNAAAMYNKALTRCGDPGTKQTLEHRIGYKDKIREAVLERQISRSRRRPFMELMSNIKSDVDRDQSLQPDLIAFMLSKMTDEQMTSLVAGADEKESLTESQYADNLKKGESSLARADLDSAEQHFAAALKTVQDPTAQQYQREVEPLCKLGDVYSKRGQQTGDGGDFVKAAALYNAAIARSKDKVLITRTVIAIKEVEKSFINCILDIHCNMSQDNTETHKKQLKEMRDQIKLEMETIDQQLDPYVQDEDDPRVREIEAKRAQAVRQLFEKIEQQRKEFISLLVEECIGLMGPPPCRYALIGLGSQATGLVTPYSDLEFAILVEEESEQYLDYFCKLTHYLHLKVVNLGETILPALGIKSLSWYYDSVTPRGFAFDGSMPEASKTPLGRQRTANHPASELICTPENMVSKLQNDAKFHLKKGYHLAAILKNPCLIVGDKDLIDTYRFLTMKILLADGGRIAQELAQETLRENINIKRFSETVTAGLINVKKRIYRFPAVAVDCLALSSCIIPTTVWRTIEEMENQQVISPNNAHHLTVLTSISAELRLRTYIANGGQKENLSALASMETLPSEYGQGPSPHVNDEQDRNALKQVFHLPNEKQLFRYYDTAVPLRNALSERSEGNLKAVLNLCSDLYDNSPRVRGMTYFELCKYRLAISYYNEALNRAGCVDSEKMVLFSHLAKAWQKVGNYQEAKSYLEQALQMYRSVHGKGAAHPDIAQLINQLGEPQYHTGDKNGISYREQALEMYRTIHGQGTAHPDIATTLSNLGANCISVGNYRKAINYIEEALKMHQTFSIYSQCTGHADIELSSLNNLAVAWTHLGDLRKAISYHEQALLMRRNIHGQTAEHPGIATSLNNLGTVWQNFGDQQRAADYYEQALKMRMSIYGHSTAHPDIARSYNNLGDTLGELGDRRKAIRYIEQGLQIYRNTYGHSTAHSSIACTLNNLGMHWHHLGDNRQAISYIKQALQMCRDIYGQSKVHPEIANTLDNLGSAWSCLDKHKSLSYNEQALLMRKEIYGKSKAHPDIARSLNNVGHAWSSLGDQKKAISYFEQALQMYRSIFGQSTAHPHIISLLLSLGKSWIDLHDDKRAKSYWQESLALAGKANPKDKAPIEQIEMIAPDFPSTASLSQHGARSYSL